MKYKENIILIGFMGTGKSTVSKELSETMEFVEIDTDKYIENNVGMSIPDIFMEYGEDYFRDLETKTLIALQDKEGLIISCGGGIVLRQENISHMKKNGKVVLLTALPETILERIKENKDRPILNNNMNVEFIKNLMNKRKDKYFSAADIIIETDGKDITTIVTEIISALE
jgi:shikimate kinase